MLETIEGQYSSVEGNKKKRCLNKQFTFSVRNLEKSRSEIKMTKANSFEHWFSVNLSDDDKKVWKCFSERRRLTIERCSWNVPIQCRFETFWTLPTVFSGLKLQSLQIAVLCIIAWKSFRNNCCRNTKPFPLVSDSHKRKPFCVVFVWRVREIWQRDSL